MKKTIRILALFVTIVLLVGALTACSISEVDLIGTWSCSYHHNGELIVASIVFNGDGTYGKAIVKEDSISSESGDYEIKGNKVILYDSSASTYHGIRTEYKYKDGGLVNNDHIFTKSN